VGLCQVSAMVCAKCLPSVTRLVTFFLLSYHPVLCVFDLIPCTSPPQEQNAVWMRLAAKESGRHDTWKSAGSSEYSYPIWQDGNCVKDAGSTDGTCTVTWKLSPNAPKGSYYVSMLNLEDSVANVRQQFFTLQKSVGAV